MGARDKLYKATMPGTRSQAVKLSHSGTARVPLLVARDRKRWQPRGYGARGRWQASDVSTRLAERRKTDIRRGPNPWGLVGTHVPVTETSRRTV